MNLSTASSTGPEASQPLAGRALSHAGSVGLLLALAALSCGGEAEGPRAAASAPEALPTGTEQADLQALIDGFTPLDPAATSNRHDAWLEEQRSVLGRLTARGGPVLGRMALEAFDADPERPDAVRAALLEVAAHGLGGELAPRLEEVITTYDASVGLRVRTEAVRVLASTSPERALEFLAPLVREDRPSGTRPPQAALVEGWILAARLVGGADTRVLSDVATNIFQPPEARYAAITGLGEFGGPLADKALEEILTESSSDGYVRRKAAQALLECVSPEVLCPILEQVAGHESDPFFLNFLGDMIDRNCAGVAPATSHGEGEHEGQR